MHTRLKVIAIIAAFCAAIPVWAHHAAVSTYDITKTTSVKGVVTKFLFRNPHARVYFDVSNADGSTSQWVGDGSASTILRREGWTAKTLEPGDYIQIIGAASRDGSPMVMMDSVSLLHADGSIASEIYGSVEDFSLTYDAALVERPLQRTDGNPNLSGIWTGQGSPYTPPRGPEPELTKAGAAVQATYDITTDPQVFCDQPGIVRQGGMTPHGVNITQYDDRVLFEYEEYGISHEAFFSADRSNTGIKTHFGDSVARYEDGVLIVETVNLLGEQIHAGGFRLSDETKVVQTYERVDEPELSALIKIRTVVSDPLYLDGDFEIVNIKIASAPYEFIENSCVPPLRERTAVHPAMNFFLTGAALNNAANSGELKDADAHCTALAATVGQGDKEWHAILSMTVADKMNAVDRTGTGPWYNAKGDVIATNLDDLYDEASSNRSEASLVSERGAAVESLADGRIYCFASSASR